MRVGRMAAAIGEKQIPHRSRSPVTGRNLAPNINGYRSRECGGEEESRHYWGDRSRGTI